MLLPLISKEKFGPKNVVPSSLGVLADLGVQGGKDSVSSSLPEIITKIVPLSSS